MDTFPNSTREYQTYDFNQMMTRDELDRDDEFKVVKDEDGNPIPVRNADPYKVIDRFLTPAPVEWSTESSQPGKREILNFCYGFNHLLVVARDPGTFETRVWSAGFGADGQLGKILLLLSD